MRILSVKPYLSYLSLDAEMRVTRSLNRTRNGFDTDLVTPLIHYRDDPLNGRIQRIDEVSDFLFPTGYDWLDEVERDRRDSVGPYSIMLPFVLRKPQVYAYFTPKVAKFNLEAMRYAFEKVFSLVPSKLQAVSVETAFSDMPKGTNLGAPYFSSDYDEYGRLVLEQSRTVIKSHFHWEIDPCLLYWRGQPKGLKEPPKQRTVWGYPHYITILELMLQIPLLHALRKRPEFAAWVGQNAVDESVSVLLDTAKHDVLSVDFSGFDASIHEEFIRRTFDLMRGWFSTRYSYLIDFVERAFLTIGLLTPEGLMIERNGGVPSGSGLTNLIDSLVQLLAFHYYCFIARNDISMALVQGDDGVISFRSQWSLSTVQEVFESVGLTVSSDKGGVSGTRVFFLQNVHSKDYRIDGVCVGIRPIMKALNGMLSYERFHRDWFPADDSIRWRQQLQTCWRHPAFLKAVSWLYESDRLSKYPLKELVYMAKGKEKVESALDMKAFPFGKLSLSELGESAVETELRLIRGRELHPTTRR